MADFPVPDTAGLPPLIPEAQAEFDKLQAPVGEPQRSPASDTSQLPVLNPDGELVNIPKHQIDAALQQGYRVAGADDIAAHERHEKYGSGGQQAIAGLEGAAKGLLGPIATAAERAAGVPAEDILGREEEHPGTSMGTQALGLLAPALLTGGASLAARAAIPGAEVALGALKAAAPFTQAGVLEKLGVAGAAKLGLEAGEGASTLMKVGSAAAKGAIDNAAFQVGDEASKAILQDPGQSAGSAIAHVGLAAVLGGGIGGALGSVHPLWEASMGTKTGQLLKSVTNKLGGMEGEAATSTVDAALQKAGLAEGIAPEVRAAMSQDPHIRELASVLQQTDTNASGKAFQEATGNFRNRVAEVQAEALGKPLGEVLGKGDVDKYSTGRKIGETLASEIDAQVSPLVKKYDQFSSKFAGKDLVPSLEQREETGAAMQDKAFGQLQKTQRELQKALKSNSPEASIAASAKVEEAQAALKVAQDYAKAPGTTDKISEQIMNKAKAEGWTDSPSSDVMKEVNRAVTELKDLKTLKQLGGYIKQVGENTASKDPFGRGTPVSRAGGIMKGIMRDAESDLIGMHIGSEEGAHVLEEYQATRKAYAEVSQLKDAVDDRLGVHGSTSGFAKGVREMAKTDGEGILRKLSGKNDADWLDLVSKRFPNTAKAIKEHHIEALLAAAKDGDSVSSAKLIKGLQGMSPQLRAFSVPEKALAKVNAAHSLLEALNDTAHNYSNTARTIDKLLGGIPGTMMGMVAALAGHNVMAAALLGGVTKTIGKDVPDAARLALLKFLGSAKPIDAPGFKAAVDYFHAAIKGEAMATTAVKNLFKAGSKVIPDTALPTDKDRVKLDKALQQLQKQPEGIASVGGKTGSYAPEHQGALAQTATGAVQFLIGIRPSTAPASPLGPKTVPNPVQKAAYNRALDIAQQPLTIINNIKEGSLRSSDVVALKTMYPDLYKQLSDKLSKQMIETVHNGDVVPYKTRLGLSLFLGQDLDPTLHASNIIAAQPIVGGPGGTQGGESQPAPKHSTNALNKLPGMYKTPGQASDERRIAKS